MSKSIAKVKSQVFAANPSDVHKSWIRVSENLRGAIPSGAYVRVTANNRTVYCQILGTPGKTGRIEINEWYRNSLGWTDPPIEAELTIKEVGLLGRLRAWSWHPEDIVRVGVGLGLTSVGLGALGILLAFLPPSIRLMASSTRSDSIWGLAFL